MTAIFFTKQDYLFCLW